MIEAVHQGRAKPSVTEGVGTIEFLLTPDEKFYFMEMNTRLAGGASRDRDGVRAWIWSSGRYASRRVPNCRLSRSDIKLTGHAIECRINAEDPLRNFAPCCGQITLLHIPGGPWVRFDTALYQGYRIPPYYDSMIGKLIVIRRHARRRPCARCRPRCARWLSRALSTPARCNPT